MISHGNVPDSKEPSENEIIQFIENKQNTIEKLATYFSTLSRPLTKEIHESVSLRNANFPNLFYFIEDHKESTVNLLKQLIRLTPDILFEGLFDSFIPEEKNLNILTKVFFSNEECFEDLTNKLSEDFIKKTFMKINDDKIGIIEYSLKSNDAITLLILGKFCEKFSNFINYYYQQYPFHFWSFGDGNNKVKKLGDYLINNEIINTATIQAIINPPNLPEYANILSFILMKLNPNFFWKLIFKANPESINELIKKTFLGTNIFLGLVVINNNNDDTATFYELMPRIKQNILEQIISAPDAGQKNFLDKLVEVKNSNKIITVFLTFINPKLILDYLIKKNSRNELDEYIYTISRNHTELTILLVKMLLNETNILSTLNPSYIGNLPLDLARTVLLKYPHLTQNEPKPIVDKGITGLFTSPFSNRNMRYALDKADSLNKNEYYLCLHSYYLLNKYMLKNLNLVVIAYLAEFTYQPFLQFIRHPLADIEVYLPNNNKKYDLSLIVKEYLGDDFGVLEEVQHQSLLSSSYSFFSSIVQTNTERLKNISFSPFK